MAAPNGARRGKRHHRALPVSLAEVIAAAKNCGRAGADAVHLHSRDSQGRHILDVGMSREMLRELSLAAPRLAVQTTTESAKRYSPAAQRKFLRDLRPPAASVALAEMLADGDVKSAARLYHWAAENEVEVQHILYRRAEVDRLAELLRGGKIPGEKLSVLFVLGRYGVCAAPSMLEKFLRGGGFNFLRRRRGFRFMVCAFGRRETECLLAAAAAGGDCRAGFENNLRHPDGTIAKDNAARILQVAAALQEGGFQRR